MKKLKYLITVCLATVAVGCSSSGSIFIDDDYTPVKETIATLPPSGVSLDKAILQGSSSLPFEQIAQMGFYVSTSQIEIGNDGIKESELIVKYPTSDITKGVFSYCLAELILGQKYYFVAFVESKSGDVKFGGQRWFVADNLAVENATPPLAVVGAIDHISAKTTIHITDLGNGKLVGFDSWLVKVYDVGVYLWEDGVGTLETAQKIQYGTEMQRNAITSNSDIELAFASLVPETKYNCVPYLVLGVYRDYDPDGLSLMEQVEGVMVNFTTNVPPPPETLTLNPSVIAITKTTIEGKVLNDGYDSYPEVGFYWSDSPLSESNKGNKVVCNLKDEGKFSSTLSGLSPDTEYFYRAYIVAFKGTSTELSGYGEPMSFKTKVLVAPEVSVPAMNYEYRYINCGVDSIRINFNIDEGSDEILACGIKWGTSGSSDAELTNDVVAAKVDTLAGKVSLTIKRLTANTTYYFKPYVKNAKADAQVSKIYSVKSAVDGGKEWLFDVTTPVALTYYDRMSQILNSPIPCRNLLYHELDPIVGVSATYYLLDRNLNASDAYKATDMGKSLTTSAPDDLSRSIGGHFVWGYDHPSTAWNVMRGIVGWVAHKAGAGASYTANPCPVGYDIPTKEQFNDMIATAQGAAIYSNLINLFDKMRLGPTGNIAGANGAVALPTSACYWFKDNGNASGAAPYFTIPFGDANASNTLTMGRASAAAIRCVKVVVTSAP